jgi:hypothetical protein
MADTGKLREELVWLLWPNFQLGVLFREIRLEYYFHIVSEFNGDSIAVSEDHNANVDSHYALDVSSWRWGFY